MGRQMAQMVLINEILISAYVQHRKLTANLEKSKVIVFRRGQISSLERKMVLWRKTLRDGQYLQLLRADVFNSA